VVWPIGRMLRHLMVAVFALNAIPCEAIVGKHSESVSELSGVLWWHFLVSLFSRVSVYDSAARLLQGKGFCDQGSRLRTRVSARPPSESLVSTTPLPPRCRPRNFRLNSFLWSHTIS
jgi:hypothetical protein